MSLTLRSDDLSGGEDLAFNNSRHRRANVDAAGDDVVNTTKKQSRSEARGCATVEDMAGDAFSSGFREESLRVRTIIHHHFKLNGASRVRGLGPEEFCRHGYVIGKASEAGFGNEMYKILTAAALSIMLNRSLIIAQTRHIGGNILLEITYPTVMFPLP